MKKGDFIRFYGGDILPAYGTILSIVKDKAKIEIMNKDLEFEVIEKNLHELTKIGTK